MRQKVDYKILEKLSDEDIEIISQNTDLRLLLDPIKQNPKRYSKYTPMLGRLEKKSVLVQKNLPNTAVTLYRKNDIAYRGVFAFSANNLKSIFVHSLKEDFGEEIQVEVYKNYSVDRYIEILTRLMEHQDYSVDINLFFLQLKMNSVLLEEEKEKRIREEWKHVQQVKEIEKKYKMKMDAFIKEQEALAKEEIRNQKSEYETKISNLCDEKKSLVTDIEAKQKLITELILENSMKDEEMKSLKNSITKSDKELRRLQKECTAFSKDVEELQVQLEDKQKKYQEQWKEEWTKTESHFVAKKEGLEKKIEELKEEIIQLVNHKEETEHAYNLAKETMDSYMESVQARLEQAVMDEKNKHSYGGEERLETVDFESQTRNSLHIEMGTKEVEQEECADYEDYQILSETNLNQIGCKMPNGILEDLFNASINAGLIPLLCGFGSRKAAIALIAARYAEYPTIISIPNGFQNIDSLDEKIRSAKTDTVVVEDLFGKMSENIILPILRKGTEKQLVFCSEDVSELKYVDSYYYNYVQLIRVSKMSIKNRFNLLYGYADEIFNTIEFSDKSEGHKLVRFLLDLEGLSDSYKVSRGDVLTYLIDKTDHTQEESMKLWIENELKWILSEEQKNKLREIMEGNETKFGDKLVRSL